MIPVIIPFYKHQDQLDRCIEHLDRQSISVEVFIRDNNVDNVYFTKAVNEGIRKYLHHDCPYLLILNQDMYLAPGAIEEMVRFMDAQPKCGIGTAVEVLMNHPQRHAAGGGLDLFPLGVRCLGPVAKYQHDQQVYWASGSCLMLRRQMIQEIGLWDENFVFIHSDGDYCLTARSRGWEVWRIGKALGHHELGSTGRTDDLNIELLKLKDVVYFSKKWLSGDLYRELSYDAQKCTPEFVLNTVNESLRKIPVLEGLIASGKDNITDLVNNPPGTPPEDQAAGTDSFALAKTLRRGTRHLQAGELTRAEGCFRQVLETEPKQPLALHGLGLISYQQENHEDALAFVSQAVGVDAQNALLHNTLGVVYEALDQYDQGIDAYQAAIKIDPRYAEACMNLAVAYWHQGLFEDARSAGQRAIELESAYADPLHAMIGRDMPTVANRTKE